MLTPSPPLQPSRRPPEEASTAAGPAPNANVVRVFLSYEGGILVLFDRAVEVDQANPPTTWSFNGSTSLQPGYGFNLPLGAGAYLLLNGIVSPGNPVVIGADDPAARTPLGGYVNAGNFMVEDL